MQNVGPAGTVVTVRTSAERRAEPELANVRLAVAFDGHQRSAVLERCTHVAAKVRASLEALGAKDALTGTAAVRPLQHWSQSRTSVWSDRPWSADGRQLAPVHHVRAEFSATFADFGQLDVWIAASAAREGVAIESIDWTLTDEHARDAVADAQIEAVTEARTKAEIYAAALGLRVVSVLQIADAGLLDPPGGAPASDTGFLGRHVKAMASGDSPLAFKPEPVVVEASIDARFLASA